ncbi:NAD(P)-binding protein [Rhizobium sp. P38BS-XIX]|uniref:FAD-dependent monooxygenase n=1 Tax=Rhizobium sp. P38BS-XIX TaxID=2726740 RepID=UPI0014567DC1|nr:FAD-dependent monooxygenase [Rhizobium sp. P38BS-XIX]NLR97366.1 NAD(P)-binding protein [Rhizobium sp. P38BS-XIX]
MPIRKALIIGGGIGGLCAAIALRQKGVETHLIEKQETPKGQGIGIIHQTNAVLAEAALGVADEVLRQGWGFAGGRVHNQAGQLLYEIPAPAGLPEGLPADMGITRSRLTAILLSRTKTLGTKITTGTTAQVIDNTSDSATVRFSNGDSDSYDLVVGADGIYSDLRQRLWGEQYRAIFSGQGGWRLNIPRPEELEHVWLYLRSDGPNCGLMPLANDLAYMWCTSNEQSAGWKDNADLPNEMNNLVKDVGGLYGELRERHLIGGADIIYRPFEYVDLPKPWHKGSVVLIGDAAHASTAHLAQGAAMAMEDAVVLGEEVAAGGAAPDVLQRWENRRYKKCVWVAETSLKLCLNEQGRLNEPGFDALTQMIEGRKRAMAPT